jgi:hypothetical protein
MKWPTYWAVASLILSAPASAWSAEPKPAAKEDEIVAGKSEVLRAMPKRFARLVAIDAARHRVTLLIEKEELPKVWNVMPDAEIKVGGFWGRLDQLQVDDRVWAWFRLDRDKQPAEIMMLADELSEQDMVGGVVVEARSDTELKIKSPRGGVRTVGIAAKDVRRGRDSSPLDSLKPGEQIFVQTARDRARLILDPAAMDLRRQEQKGALRQRWLAAGLPGRVLFLHVTGELEYLLDHEAMRWGRALRPGIQVTLQTTRPITATVRQVSPWRERTLVRLVTVGADQADLSAGQRVPLLIPAPPADVENDPLPPDRNQARAKPERIEWFLASIYCTCKVKGDGCTGHFYTLASCNPNACGMPKRMRGELAGLIDKGLTDSQIFEALLKDHGPELLRPHLLP